MAQKTPRGAALQFYESILTTQTDDCIIWPFARNENGYAVFGKPRGDVKSCLVSRVVCSDMNGMPPSLNYEAAHNCGKGNLGCINHRHLSWKTSKENSEDQLSHQTRNFGLRNGMSKLDEVSVEKIKALSGKISQAKIAAMFGIDQSTVSNVVTGKRWGWLN